MNNNGFEIERKFLIEYPKQTVLDKCNRSEITQTYLICESGITARVRKRGTDGNYTYTHTQKQKVSDIKRIELERNISEAEYMDYLKNADPCRNTVYKTRYCLDYENQMFEIDIYPFWQDKAIMELELTDENQPIDFPPDVAIIREVTSDKRYTNASLAKNLPED